MAVGGGSVPPVPGAASLSARCVHLGGEVHPRGRQSQGQGSLHLPGDQRSSPGMYGCGKDCLILIPFRLPLISCFTLSKFSHWKWMLALQNQEVD